MILLRPFCNFIVPEKKCNGNKNVNIFYAHFQRWVKGPLEFDTEIEFILHRIEEIPKWKIFWRWDGSSGKSDGRICWVREEKRIETNL